MTAEPADRRDLAVCWTCGASVSRAHLPPHVPLQLCGGDPCTAPGPCVPDPHTGAAARRATERVRRQTEAAIRRARGALT